MASGGSVVSDDLVCLVCKRPVEMDDRGLVHLQPQGPGPYHAAVTADTVALVRDNNKWRQKRILASSYGSDVVGEGTRAADCDSCRFFYARSESSGKPSRSGECRVRAWPVVNNVPVDYWCGQWRGF